MSMNQNSQFWIRRLGHVTLTVTVTFLRDVPFVAISSPAGPRCFFKKTFNKKIETKSFLCHFRSNKKCFSGFLFFSSKKSFWHWQPVVEPSCIEERSSPGTSSFGSHAVSKAKVQNRKGKPTTKCISLSARPEQASTESVVGRLKADLVTLVRTHKQGYLRELHPPGNFFAEIQEYSIAMQYVDISKERQHWQDLKCDLLKGDKNTSTNNRWRTLWKWPKWGMAKWYK